MTTSHVMLDIETVGRNSKDAAILSIGAVAFNPNDANAREDLNVFHVRVDLDGQAEAYSRVIEGGTVQWWFNPKRDAARFALMQHQTVDLPSALVGFASWMDDLPGEKLAVWGNGPTFDNVIVLNAYAGCKLLPSQKWSYHSDRCYRTMKNIPGIPAPVDFGTAHSALDDAIWQATHLQAIVAALGITL